MQLDDLYLETRLLPPLPPHPSALVAREELTARVDNAVAATPLTLVPAPAGYGKTTLLAT
jgi:LuxR family maltose regulon positive regulatory protein